MIDTSDDFSFAAPVAATEKRQRTLLLAPPSLASHPTALTNVLSQHDRSTTDLQMIDRLSAGLVNLPSATYDLVLVLADASSSLHEVLPLLTRSILGPIAESLRPKGRLQSQSGAELGQDAALAKEAVLAGLVASNGGFDKPDYGANEGVVSLKLGSKKKKLAVAAAPPAPVQTLEVKPVVPAGVGFVDFSDDLDADYDDDDLIDEDTLMTEDDLKRPINIRMLRTSLHIIHLSIFTYTDFFQIQPSNASPRPVSDAAPARTAAVVSPSASSQKTRPSVPPPTRSSRASSSPPTTSPRSTSPSRARLDPVVTALWAMLSAATDAHMSDCRRSSLVKKSGC